MIEYFTFMNLRRMCSFLEVPTSTSMPKSNLSLLFGSHSYLFLNLHAFSLRRAIHAFMVVNEVYKKRSKDSARRRIRWDLEEL